MDSSINFIYKYLAGSKSVDGFFPIYNLDGSISCKKELIAEKEIFKKYELLYEGDPDILLSAESESDNSIELIASLNGVDYNIFI
jgi:hypothetical protein